MTTNSNKIYIDSEYFYEIKRIKNRILHIPCKELKARQRYLLTAIKWLYPYSTNTLDSAKIHAGKKWILKMDIKSFYDSVPYNDIQKVVKKVCERMKQPDCVIYYLPLVTLNGQLPTGAPTSPHLANACFRKTDSKIMQFCKTMGVDYSRYVDDLTFSAYSKETLKIVEKKVMEILSGKGYRVNPKKTKYISDNKQQNILGLVVNNYRVRLPKDFKRNIRAMLHSYAINLCPSAIKDTKYMSWDLKNQQRLSGYIAYIKNVDNAFYEKLKDYAKSLEHKYFMIFPFFTTKKLLNQETDLFN